jgi:diaminopimelate decarboxylase
MNAIQTVLEKCNATRIDKNCTIYDIIKKNIIDQSKEPFYIIDLGNLVELYELWMKHLPNIQPYYAVKCNPNKVIIEMLHSLGCSFDCASKNEINQVLKITNDPNKIIFANPCKMSSHIRCASRNNIPLLTFDCEEELYKIKLNYPDSRLLLRIVVDDSKSVCPFSSKFGCNLDELENLFLIIIKLELNLVGFSFHVGSNCKSVDSYYNAFKDVRMAYDQSLKHDFPISIINIGGGFQTNDFNEIRFENMAFCIRQAQEMYFKDEMNKLAFIAEPGRFFAETTHTLVLNVIGKKRIKEQFIYYLNDGVYGSFNCILFDHNKPEIIPLHKKKDQPLFESKIFGPTCDSIDLIYENILLPELNVGEWVYVENFGAYTTAASSSFNGFKTTDYKYIYKE